MLFIRKLGNGEVSLATPLHLPTFISFTPKDDDFDDDDVVLIHDDDDDDDHETKQNVPLKDACVCRNCVPHFSTLLTLHV